MPARTSPFLSAALFTLLLCACGGDPPPPAASPAPAAAPDPAPVASGATPTSAPAPLPAAVPSPKDEDPNESDAPIVMTIELAKTTAAATFPKATTDEHTCWQSVSLSGDARHDYEALATACGKPTGLLEYAKPALGHLRSTNDKRDTFQLKVYKGWCYRYMAAADAGIKDLDILVEKPGGALIADDKQNGPVAIIESDKLWCTDDDAEFDFHIEVDGEGAGNYVFGVWARPKGRKP
jgi:hypothetical protein